jgi:ribosomal protein S18 acetylase RimI-like enzyme
MNASASEQLPSGYSIHPGSSLDRSLLVKFMQLSYREIFPEQNFSHLARTVEQYFSQDTPLWWVIGERREARGERREDRGIRENNNQLPATNYQLPITDSPKKVACLWVGNAVDQVKGDRHTYIFLLYVKPEHRRRGIGKSLMRYLENWARAKGDRQIGLQVFQSNTPALDLYHKLGYQTQSLWMVKTLENG